MRGEIFMSERGGETAPQRMLGWAVGSPEPATYSTHSVEEVRCMSEINASAPVRQM
jgi:hypothetical protein